MKYLTVTVPNEIWDHIEVDRKLIKRSTYVSLLLKRGIECKEPEEQN